MGIHHRIAKTAAILALAIPCSSASVPHRTEAANAPATAGAHRPPVEGSGATKQSSPTRKQAVRQYSFNIPQPEDVTGYEMSRGHNQAEPLRKKSGDALLIALSGEDALKRWVKPENMFCMLPLLDFDRSITIHLIDGTTADISLYPGGNFISLPNGFAVTNKTSEASIQKAIAGLDDEAIEQLRKQPRPLLYTVGTIKDGECLYGIARIFFDGDASNWKKIYEANGDIITDPNVIKSGMMLTIPAREK